MQTLDLITEIVHRLYWEKDPTIRTFLKNQLIGLIKDLDDVPRTPNQST